MYDGLRRDERRGMNVMTTVLVDGWRQGSTYYDQGAIDHYLYDHNGPNQQPMRLRVNQGMLATPAMSFVMPKCQRAPKGQ